MYVGELMPWTKRVTEGKIDYKRYPKGGSLPEWDVTELRTLWIIYIETKLEALDIN